MKETDGICLVGPWQACDIPREKMGSFMGEPEAILVPCLLGWCQTYMDTIIGGWFPGPARAGQCGHILSMLGLGEKPG